MQLRFEERPFEVSPQKGMCQIDAKDEYWQIHFYDRMLPGTPVRLCIGVNAGHQALPHEVVDELRQLNERVTVLVMATDPFLSTFKPLFDQCKMYYDLSETARNTA